MKKRLCLIIITLTILSIFSPNLIKAQTNEPDDVSRVISNEFGISPEKIPTSEEDIEKIRDEYLKQEWTKIISQNKILGPIHNFLIKINPLFLVLFKHQYEISLAFLGILILWLFIALRSAEIIKSSGIVNPGFSFLIGFIFAILLSQIRIIEITVASILNFLFSRKNWWLRAIIGIIFFGVITGFYVLSKILSQYLKQQKKSKTEEQTEQKLKEIKGLTKGITKFT